MRAEHLRHPTRESMKADRAERAQPHARHATINRRDGIRSRYQRCPKCKKLRMKWMPANWHDKGRKPWAKLDGILVCHICIERSKEATP